MPINAIPTIHQIAKLCTERFPVFDEELLMRAYACAQERCRETLRAGGEPYLAHPLRVAKKAAEWGLGSEVVAAALLHDVPGKDLMWPDFLFREFGSQIRSLVDALDELTDYRTDELPAREVSPSYFRNFDMRARYLAIADRFDRLFSLSGTGQEEILRMTAHTRSVLVPAARSVHAAFLADELEGLCFSLEDSGLYREISGRCASIKAQNFRVCHDVIESLSRIFDPKQNREIKEISHLHRCISEFRHRERSFASIYRQVVREADNINEQWDRILKKSNIAFYDLALVVNTEAAGEEDPLSPGNILIQYFELVLSPKGFYLVNLCCPSYEDAKYFLIADELDNLYRFFVRTETGQKRYLYGDAAIEAAMPFAKEAGEPVPKDYSDGIIKVFRKDGSAMWIERGATVLDFAFFVHSELGYHFDYALINGSSQKCGPYTRLSEGDMVTVVSRESIHPVLNWFKYAKTDRSTQYLVHYFSRNPLPQASGRSMQPEGRAGKP